MAGFGVGAGVRYVGKNYGDAGNTFVIPPYTLFDATVSYDLAYLRPDIRGWNMQINATNLAEQISMFILPDGTAVLRYRHGTHGARHAEICWN